MLGILLTLECVATELFYIWRNCHRVLTDLYGLRIIFFLSYKITTKFINILIKRAYNEFAFLFLFLHIGIKNPHRIGDYKTYLLMVMTFSRLSCRSIHMGR